MRVLIAWAGGSSSNLGVRVLGQASEDLLSRVWPEAVFEFMNYGARPPSVPWNARSLVKERITGRLGMMEWLSSFDVLWDTRSGDSFADIYGMDRHRTMSLIHEFAVEAGVRAIMAPQTIGPFTGREARFLARRNLKRSRLVFARDSASMQVSAELGRPVDATVTDMVFGLRPPREIEGHDIVLNVSGLLWEPNRHVDHRVYRSAVLSIIDSLISAGRDITLLPHVLDSPAADNDVPVARALHEKYEGSLRLHIPDDLDDARAVIGSSQLLIGARMHACLNALSTGVPAVAMAYSRKFSPLLNALGWEHVVSLRDGADEIAGQVVSATSRSGLADQAQDVKHRGQDLLTAMLPLIERVAA